MTLVERAINLREEYDVLCEKAFNKSALDLAILQEVLYFMNLDPATEQIKYLEEHFTLEQLLSGVQYWCDNRDGAVSVDCETAAIIIDELIAYHKADHNHLRYENTTFNFEEHRNTVRERFGLSQV